MLRRDSSGLVTYQFERLVTEDLVHAVFTRLGGVSQGPFATLNVGSTVGDQPEAVAENHRRIYNHLQLDTNHVTTPVQIHGNRVIQVGPEQIGQTIPSADGLITDLPGVALLLRFADCQPILLYDPEHHALGLVHAGWRGIALAIARRAVEAMHDAFGTRPANLITSLGPAIGPCCYTVGHNVAASMGYALKDWKQAMVPDGEDSWSFDLSAANAQQLHEAGVCVVEQAQLCTACHTDEFFSHRAERGKTGRFAVVASLGSTSPPRSLPATVAAHKPEPAEAADTGPNSLHPPGFPPF